MSVIDATHFSVAVGVVTQVVTLVLLWWLYRYTRLRPVLYNLFWHALSAVWGLGSGYLYLNKMTVTFGHGQAPRLNVYVFAVSELVSIAGTVFFVWMLIALARWGRAGLPGKTVSPSPAA